MLIRDPRQDWKASGLWMLEDHETMNQKLMICATLSLCWCWVYEKRDSVYCKDWSVTVETDSPFMPTGLFSQPLEWLKWANICTSLVWVWFIRTPCGLLSPFPSLHLWGLGISIFFLKQACVSWDWVTLIYYALGSLTKDCGTGHLFSEWWFPVLPQPYSAGAQWNIDLY